MVFNLFLFLFFSLYSQIIPFVVLAIILLQACVLNVLKMIPLFFNGIETPSTPCTPYLHFI